MNKKDFDRLAIERPAIDKNFLGVSFLKKIYKRDKISEEGDNEIKNWTFERLKNNYIVSTHYFFGIEIHNFETENQVDEYVQKVKIDDSFMGVAVLCKDDTVYTIGFIL